MITSSKEKTSRFEAKQEGDGNDTNKFTKAAAPPPPPSTSSSSSRQWSAFRNPRIVRVSRSFGGKDRHSKVYTIRGLRDRRIRLSVPTAIQLYDLQDKLGLSQPSKVIDWLLDATKNDIDKLPPLQLPQGFGQFHHQMPFSHHHHHSHNTNNVNAISQSSLIASPFFHDLNSTFNTKDGGGGFHSSLGININNNTSSGLNNDGENQERIAAKSKYWEQDQPEPEPDPNHPSITEKGKWIKTNYDQENNNQDGGFCNYSTNYGGQVSLAAQKLFPLTSNNFLNNPIPFNSYNYHWDASNLSLSHGFLPQSSLEASLNNNSTSSSSPNTSTTVPSPSSLAFSSNSQFFLCPAPATMSSLFPQYYPHPPSPLSDHNDSSRDSQHILPTSRTISLPIKNFSLNVNSGFAQYSQSNSNQRQQQPADKDTATS